MKFIKKKENNKEFIKLINKNFSINELENFSISATMIRDNPLFHVHLKNPFSKLIGSIVCREKGINLINEYSVYSHWISLFFRNFASVTNSIDNTDENKRDLIYKVIRNITNYINNKNNLEEIWDIFVREEVKNHKINMDYQLLK